MSYQNVSPYNGRLAKTFDHLNDRQIGAAIEGDSKVKGRPYATARTRKE
jgi:hypothetical protein